jgi:hypothetical protein
VRDEDLWRRRFHVFLLVRLAGVALVLLGVAIVFTDLLREGGWPLPGAVIAILGALDAVFAPRLLKKAWTEEDARR